MSAVQFESPIALNRARWSVWGGAYLVGSLFTLLWFAALAGMLQAAQHPVELAAIQELELVTPLPAEEAAPVTPVKPKPPAPKPAAPKHSEPPRAVQPLVAPTTSETSPLAPTVSDPLPEPSPLPPEETAPAPAVATPVPAAPIKVEPLFRLTRLPDFGHAATLQYPAAEKNRGREGKVIAEFVIDEQGAVRDIKILKSAGGLFDQAVIDELGKITFTPSYIGERPVAARFRREFHFKLD